MKIPDSSIALLQQVSLFAGLNEPQICDLALHCRRRKFPAHEALFHEGDPGHTLYILLSGHVKIQVMGALGETVHLAMRGPGDYVGEMALLDGKPRMADAITAEPCDLLMLDRSEFVRCVEASPHIAIRVMATLSERLREAAAQLQKQQGLDVMGRVAEVLLDLMRTHGVEETGAGKRLLVHISQQEMAERVGTTRESVNRAISGLKDTKCICIEGRRIIILSERKLQQKCMV